ncbi:MAG: radical SAM protein [Paludibacteraceae bacterium]
MKFKKIYIEITNVCNFHCSFCFPAIRAKNFMSVNDFQFVVETVKSLTNYVYLHVLGEPLLHPQFNDILKVCNEAGLQVNLSTNGSLLRKQRNTLNQYSVRQLNISLHDAEENIPESQWESFIETTLQISEELASETYINLRLWNQTHEASDRFNQLCYTVLRKHFHLPDAYQFAVKGARNVTLSSNIFLQSAPPF